MVAWKAVSKHATAGVPGSTAWTASMAASDLGWCSGARSVSDSRRCRTSPVTSTGEVYSVPPCTIRWPTASTRPNDPTAALIEALSAAPRGAARSAAAATSSCAVRTRSLRLLDPALTTSTRAGAVAFMPAPPEPAGGRRRLAASAPRPVPDLRRVLAVLPGVRPAHDPLVRHELAHVAGRAREPGHPVDHVHHQVEPVQVVEHHHVERGGGGPFLLVPAHVEVGVAVPP